MKNIYAAMSNDGRIARVTIEDPKAEGDSSIDMTAEELSLAIKGMSQVRAKMADKFTRKIDPVFHDVTRSPFTAVGKEHQVSKEFYVALRHEGYGWLAFTFEEEPGANLVLMMSNIIVSMKPRIVKPPPGLKI